jgi:hypothetical protein
MKRVTDALRTFRLPLVAVTITSLAVLIVGYFLATSRATGFFGATEAENGSLSSNASIVSDSGASGGRAIAFNAPPTPSPTPTPTPTPPPGGTQTLGCLPNPHLCGFPDGTNTGVPAGHTLTTINGDYNVTTPGTYTNLHVTGVVTVHANNVTLQYINVDCNGAGGGSCVTFYNSHDSLLDSEVGGGNDGNTFTGVGSAIYSGGDQTTQNLIQRVNIHHSDDGLRLDGGTVVRDNYIHNLSNGLNGAHNDNSQSCQGTYFSFIHNTLLGGNNDPIFLQGGDCGSDDALFLDHVLVDDNLLGALKQPGNTSSYGISIGRGRNITITHNHFDRGWEASEIGVFLSNTLVQDQTTFTKTTASNWASLGNIYDDNGGGVPFPGN